MLAMKWVHQLQNIGEHSGRPHAKDILVNTRTLTAPVPFRALVWNMGYHTAHHCYPGVPFHALPALDAEIRARRPVPTFGYLAAQREIVAGLLPGRRRAAAWNSGNSAASFGSLKGKSNCDGQFSPP